jgi:hypothetical protein
MTIEVKNPNVEVEVPLIIHSEAGKFYQAISHGALVEALEKEAQAKEIKLGNRDVHLSDDKLSAIVSFTASVPRAKLDKTISLFLGLVNSNTGNAPIRLYTGVIIVKEELPLIFDKLIVGKHTVRIDIESRMRDAIGAFLSQCGAYSTIVQQLRNKSLTRGTVDSLLVNAGVGHNMVQMMPWSRLGLVDTEFRKESDQTAYNLLRCFSKYIKLSPPLRHYDSLYKFFLTLR